MIKAIDSSGKVRIFSTITEAAKALEIDSSNIGKVVRGKRASAGGFKFEVTEERPTTRAGRKAVKQKKERAERKQLLQAVHDRLKEINVRFRNAKKEGVLASDPVLTKMMTYADYFGAGKTGGYNISISNLSQYSSVELENLMRMLNRDEKKYVKIAEREADTKNAASIAATFGISVNEVNKYKDILPVLFDLLHLAKIDNFFRYADVQVALYQVMQSGASADELQEFIDQIYEAYWGNDLDALDNIVLAMQMYGQDEEYIDEY